METRRVWLAVSRRDAPADAYELLGDVSTLGSSPGATIPVVDDPDLSPEHVTFFAREESGVRFVLSAQARAARIGDRSVRDGLVRWGEALDLGSIQVTPTDRPPTRRGTPRTSPVTVVALLALVPAAGYLVYGDGDAPLPTAPAVAPPQLFDPPPECPGGAETATFRAREAAEMASFKAERFPFAAADGIQAAALYGRAEQCFRAAGQGDDARQMSVRRRTLERQIDDEYRMYRLRLELALEHDRVADARTEVRAIRTLVRHREGEYVEWLERLDRHLELK